MEQLHTTDKFQKYFISETMEICVHLRYEYLQIRLLQEIPFESQFFIRKYIH